MRGSDRFRLLLAAAGWSALVLLGIVLTIIGLGNGPGRVYDVDISGADGSCSASDDLALDASGERLYCVVQGPGRFEPDPQPLPRPWIEDEVRQVQSAVRASPGNAQAAADAAAEQIAASHGQTDHGTGWMVLVGIVIVIIAGPAGLVIFPIDDWLLKLREARARYLDE